MNELGEIASYIEAAGYGDRVRIDPSVVRGLEYYTGPVFEAELTFEVKDEDGRPVRFGSVGGGGRYDGLVGRFRSEPVPATGFSIGVSRLAAALAALGKQGGATRVRPGRGAGHGSRPDRPLYGPRQDAARSRHPRRDVSRQPEEPRQPVQICRPPQQPLRRHPGLRTSARPARCRSRI